MKFREIQRETTVELGDRVMKLSTRCEDRLNNGPSEVKDEEIKLRQLMRELEVIQRQVMVRHQQKENLLARRASQQTSGGVKGNVGVACNHLTTFTLDSEDDVL